MFIVRNNVLKTTPGVSILEGINRDAIMCLAEDLGYRVVEQVFTRDEMYTADEAFFCGTAAEVTPIRELDDRIIGAGHAGPATNAIQKAFFEAAHGENEKYAHWLTHYRF